MKKFIAKLLFRVNVESGSDRSEFEEQFRLIEAEDPDTAILKARSVGKKEESGIKDRTNKTIRWEFIGVADLHMIDGFRDGEQVWSSTNMSDDPESYIKYIRLRSMELQAKSLTFA